MGTEKLLIVNYQTKAHGAKEIPGWPRWAGIDNLDNRSFKPFRDETLGCLVFMPRLELVYIENDKIHCNFYGGDQCNAPIQIGGTTEKINTNRVIYRLDSSAFALEKFILNKRVSLTLTHFKCYL